MQQKHNNKKDQDKKTSSPGKILPQENDEGFNTDSHKSSSSRNVGPGYDDTGLGNDAEASLNEENKRKPEKKQKNQKS